MSNCDTKQQAYIEYIRDCVHDDCSRENGRQMLKTFFDTYKNNAYFASVIMALDLFFNSVED